MRSTQARMLANWRLEDLLIAEALIEDPWNDRGGVAPGRGSRIPLPQDVRDHERDRAVRGLLCGQIFQPGREEARAVEEEAARSGENTWMSPVQPSRSSR